MKERTRLRLCQFADVVSTVKVQRVVAGATNPELADIIAFALDGRHQIKFTLGSLSPTNTMTLKQGDVNSSTIDGCTFS